ncbi:EAL domain-containing protein [Erwinia psidii]|uniref:cyclic-guanylate-specific phosphodiesterase n=1 Tax=Erwinia psidii TaxID=69224 RepID=A0A3N6S2X6_9GAMM|nr:cyclic diguanylate phosphodiesterase [Erwinia psidii]MCX8956184.1 cyclic diguanylate phosphodiesterase [Erwinia psidii]MCX8960056.1 cyclic diguanylate phosphodiesterase [Erwinia psidii]MCX8963601.1 cyclic diguanylate phosphodiesterase [Erwinia psidii]RQM39187.1 cyclic diguanylate phosphodiesterase [Erwinia psidii]
MQVSQEVFGQFRRKRLFIALAVSALVLILTLSQRFFEEKNRIEKQSRTFASNAIQRFDRLFSPLEVAASNTLGLVGLPCDQVRFPLIEKLASLQTVRSIILVDRDIMYCSSIFGQSDRSFSTSFPELAVNNQRMILSIDDRILKGSPVLLLWTTEDTDNHAGILQIINIEMISNYLLEPTLPWVERAIFNVGGKSLEYGNQLLEQASPSDHEVSYQESSLRYPFSITLYGPAPARMALVTLPSQLPLALLLSLLTGYIAWLATANRMSLAWQISYGITTREFMVYCQPLINSRTGECDGIELLLRWHNHRQGWVPPDVFIPLAEQHNLIAALTRFVLSEVVRQLPALPTSPTFHIAINVASGHFHDQEIIDDLQKLWWPARPIPQLIVELTERDALPVVDQRVVSHLHRIGVKLAIDDFGTGHSSLSYLKTLSPDVLKIDKVFTAAIGTDAINATVTDMVISLAQRLNISLVAEGVETAEQAEYLRERGVDVLQGYFFARPMPLGDFPEWLSEYKTSLRQ